MRKFAALAIALAMTGTAFGQAQQQQTENQQNSNKFNCKLFRVSPDSHQMTVIQGDFQRSGLGGSDKEQPADPNAPTPKRYTVKVDDQTNIHWQNGSEANQPGEKLTLTQLQKMSQGQIVIPMTVYYPKNAQLDESTPVAASEIVLKGSSRQNPEKDNSRR